MRILVVDDEKVHRDRLLAVLAKADHTTVEAGSGREAIEVLEREPIDLVVTDVVMPDMDGIELVRRIKRDFEGVESIVLSASDYSQDAVFLKMARKLGADAAFKKSVSPEELRLILDTFERR